MTIYIDENMPPTLARGFHILQYPENLNLNISDPLIVKSVSDVFGRGTKDEDWIPKVSLESGCVISQDYKLNRIKEQRELCKKYNLGMIYLRPPSNSGFSYWQMLTQLVKHWPEIIKVCSTVPKPFVFVITPKSKKLESLLS